jgi:small-conductance mechanosensitive channel
MQAATTALRALITHPLTLAGVMIVVGVVVLSVRLRTRPIARFLCQLLVFAAFTALLAVARVSPLEPTAAMDVSAAYLTVSALKIAWWLAVSWLFAGFMRALLVFQRKPMETRFLQDLVGGAMYVGAIFGIIAYVFDTPISGLLAASGVIAIVLGLALQSTLGDVFSGIALDISKPYRPGDWLMLDGGPEGRVVQTNWRATQILTIANDLATVPNSIIARSRLVNASAPFGAHGITVTVRLDPSVAPSAGVAVLAAAALSCSRILRMPAANVAVRSLDAMALTCDLQFFVDRIEQGQDAQNDMFDLVFRHCLSAGIRLAPPAGSAAVLPARGPPQDPADIPRRLLERLPLFASLSDAERLALAPRMTRRTYKTGEVVVEQGVVAPGLLILTSGVLAALQVHEGRDVEVLRFAPGDSFCQSSVLSGARTTFKVVALARSVVYEMLQVDIGPVVEARPAIAAELALVMARREAAGMARLGALEETGPHVANLADRIRTWLKV